MTEAAAVRAALRTHLGPLLRLVPTSQPVATTHTGMPDHYWCGRGASGWIESKVVAANGKPPAHFTLEQLMWGEDEVAWGGKWYLLGLVLKEPRRWWLFDARGARAWFDGRWPPEPMIDVGGAFPTRQVLRALVGSNALMSSLG